jgi:VWFA-related protein
MRRLLLRLVLVALPVGLAAQSPVPQGPTLRAEVDQVVVDVVALDKAGAPVAGLTAADFEVRERGKPQAISTFSEVTLPFTPRADDAPLLVPSDVRSNVDAERRRLYAIVLDDENVEVEYTAEVHRYARTFVRRAVQPGDLVSLVTTSALGQGQAEFTDDLQRVDAAILRFAGRKPSEVVALTMDRIQSGERNPDRMTAKGVGDDRAGADMASGMLALRTLANVADSLASVDGRKAVVFVSMGVPIREGSWESSEADALLRDVVDAAARANVTIYAFNPIGLKHHEVGAAASLSPLQIQRNAPGAERRAIARMLEGLAERTGGQAFLDRNDPTPGVLRVAAESSHYYLLGYPQTGKRDGRFRSLEVTCKRPGVIVRARRGYYAPDDKAQERRERETRKHAPPQSPIERELSGIVGRAAWTGGVPLSAYAVALPGTQKNVRVVIEVAPGAVDTGTPERGAELGFDLMILPVMAGGHVLPSVQSRVTLDAATIEDVRTHGVRLVEALTLPPDTYQLRIGVRDRQRGVTGSVFVDVDVADPRQAGLVMSDLVVGAKGAGRMPSATIDRQLSALLGGPPTASRAFDVGGTLRAYAEFADAKGGKDIDVALTTIVRSASGAERLRRQEPAATARSTADRGIGYVIDLPLEGLGPGAYTLRVEGHAAGRQAPLAREVGFTVRGAGS